MAKRPLPEKYKTAGVEKAVFKLVSKKGVSKTICQNKLRLPVNYFNHFVGTADNFDAAMAKFTSDVLMVAVTGSLDMDSAGRKYLMQKLRVFDKEIDLPVKKMTCAKHASQNLSHALAAYAKKELTEDSLQAIRGACEVFAKLMVSTDIESRLAEIEKKFDENS